MITLPRTVRVWAYGKPTDLRKGYNGLVGLVEKERGRFADLWRDGAPVKLTSSELALFIEGCALVGRQALSPTEITSKSLVVFDRA